MWHALSDVDLANSQKHVVITYIASNLLDTGLAIYYCKFINNSKGARAKYRFVRAFLLLNSVFNRCGILSTVSGQAARFLKIPQYPCAHSSGVCRYYPDS